MARPKLFYVSLSGLGGVCALVRASTRYTAERYALRQWGQHASPRVRLATDDDEAWHAMMGGAIHEA